MIFISFLKNCAVSLAVFTYACIFLKGVFIYLLAEQVLFFIRRFYSLLPNPAALSMAKTPQGFGRSECNRDEVLCID